MLITVNRGELASVQNRRKMKREENKKLNAHKILIDKQNIKQWNVLSSLDFMAAPHRSLMFLGNGKTIKMKSWEVFDEENARDTVAKKGTNEMRKKKEKKWRNK